MKSRLFKNGLAVLGISFIFTIEPAWGAPSFCEKLYSLLGLGSKKTEEINHQAEDMKRPPGELLSPFSKDMMALRKIRETKDKEEKERLYDEYTTTFPEKWYDKYFTWAANGMVGGLALKAAAGYTGDPNSLLYGPAAALTGYYLADIGSQGLHKALDSFLSDRHPVWGAMVRAFRVHHDVPTNLNQNTYAGTISPVAKGLFLPIAASLATTSDPTTALFLSTLYFGALHGVEFHRQSHRPGGPSNKLMKWIQDNGFAISREQHAEHHRPPFGGHYSVLNNWAEPLFAYTGVWDKLDRLYWKVYKKMPYNWITSPKDIPEDIRKELTQKLDSLIPQELMAAREGYPHRWPKNDPEFAKAVDKANVQWRQHYIEHRQRFFRTLAMVDGHYDQAHREWAEEQKSPEMEWIYRGELRPLFEEDNAVDESMK